MIHTQILRVGCCPSRPTSAVRIRKRRFVAAPTSALKLLQLPRAGHQVVIKGICSTAKVAAGAAHCGLDEVADALMGRPIMVATRVIRLPAESGRLLAC